MNISLKQLRYFDAVVRQAHFGKAAEQCSVTQPALSMQIQVLEKALGVQLLERALDLLLLALPVEHPDTETIKLFSDRFLLALPKARHIAANRVRATPELLQQDRLLLLEEGHCLREQALSFCNLRRVDNIDMFGASNLSTIVQMVANGLGMALLPELSVDLECRRGSGSEKRISLMLPRRVVGLAFRKSSPRKRDFAALGKLIAQAASAQIRDKEEERGAAQESWRIERLR